MSCFVVPGRAVFVGLKPTEHGLGVMPFQGWWGQLNIALLASGIMCWIFCFVSCWGYVNIYIYIYQSHKHVCAFGTVSLTAVLWVCVQRVLARRVPRAKFLELTTTNVHSSSPSLSFLFCVRSSSHLKKTLDGIGKAMAFEMAKKGMSVLLISRTESKLVDAEAELKTACPSVAVEHLAIDYSNFDAALQVPDSRSTTNDSSTNNQRVCLGLPWVYVVFLFYFGEFPNGDRTRLDRTGPDRT